MTAFRWAESDEDRKACLAIRHDVFCGEQDVLQEEEVDGLDSVCLHVLGVDGDGPVAALRVLPKDGWAKVQRVAVLRRARGTGTGAALMRWTLDRLPARGFAGAVLGSQVHAMGFYERLGFVAEGPDYLDARIPHRDMRLAFGENVAAHAKP